MSTPIDDFIDDRMGRMNQDNLSYITDLLNNNKQAERKRKIHNRTMSSIGISSIEQHQRHQEDPLSQMNHHQLIPQYKAKEFQTKSKILCSSIHEQDLNKGQKDLNYCIQQQLIQKQISNQIQTFSSKEKNLSSDHVSQLNEQITQTSSYDINVTNGDDAKSCFTQNFQEEENVNSNSRVLTARQTHFYKEEMESDLTVHKRARGTKKLSSQRSLNETLPIFRSTNQKGSFRNSSRSIINLLEKNNNNISSENINKSEINNHLSFKIENTSNNCDQQEIKGNKNSISNSQDRKECKQKKFLTFLNGLLSYLVDNDTQQNIDSFKQKNKSSYQSINSIDKVLLNLKSSQDEGQHKQLPQQLMEENEILKKQVDLLTSSLKEEVFKKNIQLDKIKSLYQINHQNNERIQSLENFLSLTERRLKEVMIKLKQTQEQLSNEQVYHENTKVTLSKVCQQLIEIQNNSDNNIRRNNNNNTHQNNCSQYYSPSNNNDINNNSNIDINSNEQLFNTQINTQFFKNSIHSIHETSENNSSNINQINSSNLIGMIKKSGVVSQYLPHSSQTLLTQSGHLIQKIGGQNSQICKPQHHNQHLLIARQQSNVLKQQNINYQKKENDSSSLNQIEQSNLNLQIHKYIPIKAIPKQISLIKNNKQDQQSSLSQLKLSQIQQKESQLLLTDNDEDFFKNSNSEEQKEQQKINLNNKDQSDFVLNKENETLNSSQDLISSFDKQPSKNKQMLKNLTNFSNLPIIASDKIYFQKKQNNDKINSSSTTKPLIISREISSKDNFFSETQRIPSPLQYQASKQESVNNKSHSQELKNNFQSQIHHKSFSCQQGFFNNFHFDLKMNKASRQQFSNPALSENVQSQEINLLNDYKSGEDTSFIKNQIQLPKFDKFSFKNPIQVPSAQDYFDDLSQSDAL